MVRFKEDDLGKRLVVLWACWNGRNEDYYGEERLYGCSVSDKARGIVNKAVCYWEAWKKVQLSRETGGRVVREEMVKWKPPARSVWKINVDAAVLGDMGSGFGLVIRDADGKVERMGVLQVLEAWSPKIAEAKAAEFGLLTARQMGLENVVLESDSLLLITMLKSKSFPLNYFGRVGKVVYDLASHFNCFQFSFTRREGNAVAHCLAHLLPLTYSTRFWVGSVPEAIAPLVFVDNFGLHS
ncbi:uncharacterized protein LOC141631488 [Silene latifolia]|uniref:uncharacterized protein LOC141631488 n=1 Tax=Silene latifolia TaxID=37657 RepID=UPI003D779DEA